MKSGWGMICIILAVVMIGIGIYLFPASLWRNISIACLVIGGVFLIAGIIMIRKKRQQ